MSEFSFFRFSAEERKLLERGSTIYRELCVSCHGPDGQGAPLAGAPAGTTMAPALAGSRRVQGHRDYVVSVLLHGLIGPIDGKSYQSLMAPMGANDDAWIASISSYVRNAFGNSASVVKPEEVAKARTAAGKRNFPWTVAELESTSPGFLRYRPDWIVSSSHHAEYAGFAINSPGFVRWDTGESQQAGMWFQIELPQPATIGEVQFDSPGSFGNIPGTFPRGYKVQTSLDGKTWETPVAAGKGNGPSTRIVLKPSPARLLRIALTTPATDGAVWAIQRTRLFEAVKPDTEVRAPRVGALALAQVLDAVAATRGDPRRGENLFAELSCVACHTVRADEPPKGPFLGKTVGTYRRRDLAEQVLTPSKLIAKGYETNQFALKDGRQLEGFVVHESSHDVIIRTISAQEQTIPVAEIEERRKGEKSVMPEGLVANLTVADLASLVDFLESLAPAAPAVAKP
jgi:putative heme-binding domain-containing protein